MTENPINEERLLWLNGKLLPAKEAKINVLAPTSQFGLNVFEGIRCYWNEETQQLFAFRLADHYRRLKRSQRLLKMEDSYTPDELQKALIETVRANGYREDIAVRQTLFVDGFGSWSSHGPVGMFVSPVRKAGISPEYQKKGLRCCVSSWVRIQDNSLSPRIKCGANYINSRMAQLEALDNGYDTAVFLNHHGSVAEAPGSCLFIVRDRRLITPLATDSVLESITRDSVLVLAREMGIETMERTVDRTELYLCDEAFLCGSSMEITPVVSVDGFAVGNGSAGAVTAALRAEYRKAVTGRLKNHTDWLTEIDL